MRKTSRKPSAKLQKESICVAHDIRRDLQAGRRVKDIGDAKRIAFLSAELKSVLLANDHPAPMYSFTLKLGPDRIGRYTDDDGNFNSHALRKEMARTLRRHTDEDEDEDEDTDKDIVGIHWNVVELQSRNGLLVAPHLHGLMVFRPEYEAKVKSAFQSFSTFRSKPSQALKLELINTPADALRWAVYSTKYGEPSYRTKKTIKFTCDLWKRACRKISGTSDPWITGL